MSTLNRDVPEGVRDERAARAVRLRAEAVMARVRARKKEAGARLSLSSILADRDADRR